MRVREGVARVAVDEVADGVAREVVVDDRQVVDVLVAGPVEFPAVDGGRRPDDLGRLEERAAVAVREPPDLPPHVLDVDVEGAVHGPAHDELVDARALPRRPHGRRNGLSLHRRGVGEVPAVRRAGLRVRDREPRRLVGLDEDRGRDAVQERVAVRRALAVLVGHAQAQAARRCQRFRRGSSHAAAERQRAEAGGGQQGRPSPSLRRRRGRRRRTAAQGQRLLSERHQATPRAALLSKAHPIKAPQAIRCFVSCDTLNAASTEKGPFYVDIAFLNSSVDSKLPRLDLHARRRQDLSTDCYPQTPTP